MSVERIESYADQCDLIALVKDIDPERIGLKTHKDMIILIMKLVKRINKLEMDLDDSQLLLSALRERKNKQIQELRNGM